MPTSVSPAATPVIGKAGEIAPGVETGALRRAAPSRMKMVCAAAVEAKRPAAEKRIARPERARTERLVVIIGVKLDRRGWWVVECMISERSGRATQRVAMPNMSFCERLYTS